MCLTELYQLAIVVELVGILVLEGPVDGIDRVGRFIRIVDTLLVAEHFFAGKHERCALRGKHYGLGQACGTLTIGLATAGHRSCQFVGEGEVVVTRHVVDDLGRGTGIGEFRVVTLAVVDLRMCGRSHDTDFHGFLVAGLSGSETAVLGIAIVTFDGIADIVGENGDAGHFVDILLECALFGGKRRISGSPPLAVYENRRIDLLEFGSRQIVAEKRDGHDICYVAKTHLAYIIKVCPWQCGNSSRHIQTSVGSDTALDRLCE